MNVQPTNLASLSESFESTTGRGTNESFWQEQAKRLMKENKLAKKMREGWEKEATKENMKLQLTLKERQK